MWLTEDKSTRVWSAVCDEFHCVEPDSKTVVTVGIFERILYWKLREHAYLQGMTIPAHKSPREIVHFRFTG